MNRRRCAAFTWAELVVTIAVIAVLALLALPPMTSGHRPQPLSHAWHNMKLLHMATHSMALDGTTTEETNLAWPGSQDGTFSTWAKSLVPSYLSTNDFCLALSAKGMRIDPQSLPTENRNAILVYAVSEEDAEKKVFLTTANFTNTPTGGSPLRADAKPLGRMGFVVFRKGGDGVILRAEEVGRTNLIGTYAPLLR
jgi:Tfp pilus assembly protein FimT